MQKKGISLRQEKKASALKFPFVLLSVSFPTVLGRNAKGSTKGKAKAKGKGKLLFAFVVDDTENEKKFPER